MIEVLNSNQSTREGRSCSHIEKRLATVEISIEKYNELPKIITDS